MEQKINYGSLCTGYDGAGLALEIAGLTLDRRFHAETEPTVSEVLKAEHPEAPNVGDIKELDWSWAWPQIDVMSSGDPCQSISIAGRQLGREDPRFLWPWVREAYREIKPGRIFLENVANMVSHDKGQTMAERFQHLREDGYAVRWTVLGACAVGAPHHRHRWYAVAECVGPGAPEAVRVGGSKAICGAPRNGGRVLLPSPAARDGDGRNEGDPEFWRRKFERDPSRVGKGIPLGAAVNLLPTPNAREGGERGFPSREHAAKRAANPERSLNLEDAIALLPTPMADRSGSNRGGSAGREGQPLRPSLDGVAHLLPTLRATDVSTAGRRNSEGWRPQLGQAVIETWGKYADAVALWEQITGVPAPVPTVPGPKAGVRLNPELPEWMMGLRPGLLTDRMDRNAALRAAGNGIAPLAAAAAWRMLTD